MRGIAVAVSVCLLVAALVGCFGARPMSLQVTPYSRGPDLRGQTVAVVPSDTQQGDLEWASLAERVGGELTKHGLVVTHKESARYVALFDYYVGEPRAMSYSRHSTRTVAGTAHTNMSTPGTISTTTYTPPSVVTSSSSGSYAAYDRTLIMTIFDQTEQVPDKPMPVYQSTVRSTGRTGNLSIVAPYLIEALFKDFPGQSGKTTKVELRMD